MKDRIPDTSNSAATDLLERLTPGERLVLRAMFKCGGSVDSAAKHLSLSARTVETHLNDARDKLGVRSTLEAVLLFLRDSV